MVRVIHTDLELYLTARVRAELAARPEPYAQNVQIVNKEPDPGEPLPLRLVVIRDDGGPDTSVITAERAVGVSTLAGTRENPQECADLARLVHAIVRDVAGLEPGNPVAAVVESNGPIAVPEAQPRARRYSTFVMSVTGVPLTT